MVAVAAAEVIIAMKGGQDQDLIHLDTNNEDVDHQIVDIQEM